MKLTVLGIGWVISATLLAMVFANEYKAVVVPVVASLQGVLR